MIVGECFGDVFVNWYCDVMIGNVCIGGGGGSGGNFNFGFIILINGFCGSINGNMNCFNFGFGNCCF